MKTFGEYLTESVEGDKTKRWLVAAVKSAWKDMDTKKGRWFAANAPTKLVADALDKAITEQMVSQVAKIAATATAANPKLKSIDTIVNSNTPVGNKILNYVIAAQKEMFKYVAREGDKPEWKDKWRGGDK